MSDEKWLPIAGWEGLYEVSTLARVKRLPRSHNIGKKGDCLKAGKNSSGYLGVVLHCGERNEWRSLHRLVATAFIPNHNGHPFVNHIDHNKMNNVPCNLEWCTAKHNSQHAARGGRIRSGGKHPNAAPIRLYKDGKFIGKYPTIKEASDASGASYPSLCYGGSCGYSIKRTTPKKKRVFYAKST